MRVAYPNLSANPQRNAYPAVRGERRTLLLFGSLLASLRAWRGRTGTLADEEREHERMEPAITIRDETDADVSAIAGVTVAAFKTLAISNHTEQFIIEALRAAKALTV